MSILFSEVYTLDSHATLDFPTIEINHDTFARTLQDVSFPDKAGGFIFSSDSKNLLTNRFILWRSHADILELQEVSLHQNLESNVLKVSFGGSAVISCQISETPEMIVCSVCTSHGASKLLFTHPRMMFDTTHVSALGNKKNVRYSFHQIKGLQPSAIRCATAFVHHLSGVSVFAYGLSTGSIIVARVPVLGSSITENTEVFELCQASMIQKLWCGITPFSSKTDNDSVSSPLDILSLSLGCDEYLLATICKDHRLRLWDLKHRNCFVMLDLLEILPKTHDVVLSSDQSVLRSSFAPGLCHRLSSSPASDHVINLVVYLSMCLSASSNSVNLDFASSEDVNSSYWCWMQLDVDKALNRNRDCLRVLQVEPLFQHLLRNVSNENSAQLWSYKSNMNSLLKMSRPDVSVLDFVPSEIKQKSETGSDSRENRKGSNSALGGIWWIAHQTNTGDTDLDSNYFVRWTEIKNSECDSNKYKRTISAFPPGVNLLQPLPNWHRIPEYLMQLSSQERTDSLWEETSVDAQLQIFLDYLFHPGCLSWFAITNAFKSLCESYALPDCDLVSTASNLHEMRVCVHRTLVDKVIPKLDRDGIGTMFKTFYSTAIDYHEHGLQPLGLLRIHTKTASTSSGQTMFPCEDTVVVIRRWGFSILRQLQDVEILLWNNIPPVVGRLQSSYSKTNTQAIIDLTTDCRKILHVLNEQPNWPKWESCLFDHIKSDLSPLLLVEQVIEQLDQINECWLPPPISSSVKFMSPFCTGSLSSSQLSAVTCLISLLDSYGTMEKSVQSLQSLFDMDASSTCYDMEITSQSWLNNNSRFSGERNSFNPLNRRSLLSDGGCSKFIESLSNSSVEFLRQSCCESTETRILFTFALLILIRRNELASNGLVMVCDRTDNSNIDDKDDDIEEKDININWHSTAKWRLVSLIRSLGFLRTLTVIRVRPTPDMDKLSIIRDHLNALGIHDLSLSAKQLDTSFKHSSSPHSPVIISQTPGMTIFEQIWFNWDWLKLCYSKTCTFPSSSDWLEFSHHILLEFSKLLVPTTDGGQGIVFVFWMLLWCGHPSELVKLCMLLLPPEDVFSKQRDIEDQDRILREPFTDLEAVKIAGECDSWTSQAADSDGDSRRISWWWEKDFSFIHLCIGLAKLWLGEPVPAKKHFIIATNWLYRYTQLFINNLLESSQPTSPLLSITAVSSVNQVPKLLIPILFPREFTLPKLFCLNRTSGCTGAVSAHSLSPDEVQIRFLMKLMSIFEVSNYVTEVLDLAEFCLNRLAESSQNLASLLENCSDQGSVIKSSRRLASVLASLRGIIENDDVNGFLCESNKLTNFVEYGIGSTADEAQSGIRARLADLEAALWTRMFKHELALGHYTKAYMILRSNPDVARRRDCLRQLVVTVCDRGEASKLVSFHYGPMENEFLAILEAKARATDVVILPDASNEKCTFPGSNPYYDVLYSYHIHRADYRAAASVMFEHSCRLIEDTMLAASRVNSFRSGGARILVGLQRQAACLAAAINALYLVPKDNQWLVSVGFAHEGVVLDENVVETESESLDHNDDWAFANPDDVAVDIIEEEAKSNGQLVDNSPQHEVTKRGAINDSSPQEIGKDKRILTLKDLLNVYSLARARLRLAQACWEQGMLRAGTFSPDEVVQGLLSVALYDEAVRLSESYQLDPTPIIYSISLRCSELAQCAALGGSFNTVDFSQAAVGQELHRKDMYSVHRTVSGASTGYNQFPILPGLSNDSSPVEHEVDLVQQSLSSLVTLNLDKNKNCVVDGSTERSANLKSDLHCSNYSNSARCNLPGLYWRLLEAVLTRLDPPYPNEKQIGFKSQFHGLLHLVACENILSSRPNQLYLPEWLTSRLLSTSCATERTVSLLRLYLKYNRLETAYRLATDMLATAVGNGADPSSFGLRSTLPQSMKFNQALCNVIRKKNKTMLSGAMYLPHTLFVQILNALEMLSSQSKTFKTMHENLQIALRTYFLTLQPICSKLMDGDSDMDKQFGQKLIPRQQCA